MEKPKDVTRAKAIRLFCIDCSGGSKKEVRLCPVTDCPLYPWRMGRGYLPGKEGEAECEPAGIETKGELLSLVHKKPIETHAKENWEGNIWPKNSPRVA